MKGYSVMFTRRTVILASATVLVCLFSAVASAQDFHFTVTVDQRRYHDGFATVLAGINANVGGHGAFHVSPGDIDQNISDNRVKIDNAFGASAIWYPGVGNHEAESIAADMPWLRLEYGGGNGVRTPLKEFTNQDGPLSSPQTTYSWDYGNAHFIMLNEYWDGAYNDAATIYGDIVPELHDWLADNLAANTKPFVFIFGHEPAFPYNRHVGDSLDRNPARRDAFWSLLESEGVSAYMVGHTHYYSKHQGDKDNVGEVWQLDVGNARGRPLASEADGSTFFDVVVGTDQAVVNVYRDNGTGTFFLADSVTVIPEPASATLLLLGALGMLRRRRRS